MNSPSSSRNQAITLTIQGCGHVCAFKNTKMLLPARGNRRAMLITDPKKQALMKQYEARIESDLRSAYQTAGGETGTGLSLPSWIASSVFLDDSLDWIPESDGYRVERVAKGEEGAVVYIQKI
jgi:hypothetical protein